MVDQIFYRLWPEDAPFPKEERDIDRDVA